MRPTLSVLTTVISTTLLAAAAHTAHGQTMTQTSAGTGGSPHVTAVWTINGAAISITYGRPYLKGRPESQMMPLDKPWRTGADEATVITSDKPLRFDTLTLSPGSYTINTQPGAKAWQLIIGKLGTAKQWGIPYLPALEIGRAPMKLGKTSAPVEQVTYSIDRTATGATLRVEWGTVSATVPFTIAK